MAKFQMKPLIGTAAKTSRLGPAAGAGNLFNDNDVGKPVKLAGESRHDLCAAGDEIRRFVSSVDTATADGFSTGGVVGEQGDFFEVTFDGLQATPGVGNVAVGDFVVAGTAVARNTALVGAPKVCKATAAPADIVFKWQVVSLGSAGTGAPGTVGVIERV